MKPNLEKFQKFLKFSNSKITILVEGKKDKKILNFFGFKNVIPISSQLPTKIKDKIKTKEIAILTDFDEEGEMMRKRFQTFFQYYNFKINNFLPKLIRSLGIKSIEELNFYKKLEECKIE